MNGKSMNKTPRAFRNALYQHLVDHGATENAASQIAGEAELYANGYEHFKLRDINFAVRSMGYVAAKIKKEET